MLTGMNGDIHPGNWGKMDACSNYDWEAKYHVQDVSGQLACWGLLDYLQASRSIRAATMPKRDRAG